jgi:hypothetical protein
MLQNLLTQGHLSMLLFLLFWSPVLLAAAATGLLLVASSLHSSSSSSSCCNSPPMSKQGCITSTQQQGNAQAQASTDRNNRRWDQHHVMALRQWWLQSSALHQVLAGLQAVLDTVITVAAQLGWAGLLVLTSALSLLYCITDLAAAVTSALQCTELDTAGDLLPGEVRSAQGRWWSQDLHTPCFSRVHFGVAVVAGVVGLPLLLWTVLVVVSSCRKCRAEEVVPAGRLQWRRLQQLSVTNSVSNSPASLQVTNGSGWSGVRQSSHMALHMFGWMLTMSFYDRTWWCSAVCIVWRVLLAAGVAALSSSAGSSSVMLAALAASAWLSCLQLLHAVLLPAAYPAGANALIAGSYMALQAMCLLMAGGGMTNVSAGVGGGLLTAAAVIGSCMCLYLMFKVLRALVR